MEGVMPSLKGKRQVDAVGSTCSKISLWKPREDLHCSVRRRLEETLCAFHMALGWDFPGLLKPPGALLAVGMGHLDLFEIAAFRRGIAPSLWCRR